MEINIKVFVNTQPMFVHSRSLTYVNAQRQVCKGVLVMALNLTADVAVSPSDHTAHFIGDRPCDSQGRPLEQIINSSGTNQLLSDLVVNHYFSAKPKTGNYLKEKYGEMHRNITAHPCMIIAENVAELGAFDYVFLSVDNAAVRDLVVKALRGTRTSLLDVGMGVHLVGDTQQVWGMCRVTTLTPGHHEHANRTMPLTENSAEDAYRSNIQIADLNALNAVLAVGTWKRLCGFYVDQVHADHFTYSTNLNEMGNSEERP